MTRANSHDDPGRSHDDPGRTATMTPGEQPRRPGRAYRRRSAVEWLEWLIAVCRGPFSPGRSGIVRPGERRGYMSNPLIVLAIALLVAMLVIDRLAR